MKLEEQGLNRLRRGTVITAIIAAVLADMILTRVLQFWLSKCTSSTVAILIAPAPLYWVILRPSSRLSPVHARRAAVAFSLACLLLAVGVLLI